MFLSVANDGKERKKKKIAGRYRICPYLYNNHPKSTSITSITQKPIRSEYVAPLSLPCA